MIDRSRRLALAWMGAAMAAPLLARAQHQHHRMAAPGAPALGATAVYDRSGVLWSAYTEGAQVLLARSTDLGRTWSAGTRVNPSPEATDPGGDARPKIALGTEGEIYVSWTRALDQPYTGEIRFSRSLDGGRSFSAPVTVHKDRQLIAHRFDSMVVDREGRVFVAWIDKREVAAAMVAGLTAHRGAAVYFAVSGDRGASFGGDYRLAEHSCECCRIALALGQDGGVRAMWRHVFDPNVRDHAVAQMYPDGRAGELQRVSFDDWRSDACPHHGPALATDAAGRLHCAWFTGAEGRAGVYYARLRGAEVEALRRIGAETAAHADIAVSGARVALAWKEFDGRQSQLCALLSEDGGERFRLLRLDSTAGPSGRPQLLLAHDRFYAFWNRLHEPLSLVQLT